MASQYLRKIQPADPCEGSASGLVRLGVAVTIVGLVVLALHLAASDSPAIDSTPQTATATEPAR